MGIPGEQDTRVNVKESVAVYTAAFKQAGNRDVTITVFPEANHHIRVQQRQTIKGTKQAGDIFAPGFLELIEEWLQQRFPTQRKKQQDG